MTILRALGSGLALAFTGGGAAAQAAPPLVTRAAAARVVPITWTYVTTLKMGEGTPQRIGFRTLRVVPATYHGTAAWLVIDGKQLHTVDYADSLYVSRRDLSPLWLAQHSPSGSVTSRYAADSAHTTFAEDSAQGTISTALAPGVLPNLALLEVLIGADSLHAGWAASAPLAAITLQQSGMVPVSARVVGQEAVPIPDGTFDAWVVALRMGSSEERLWVRKQDGVVIKESLPVVGMGGAQVEVILGLHGVGKPASN